MTAAKRLLAVCSVWGGLLVMATACGGGAGGGGADGAGGAGEGGGDGEGGNEGDGKGGGEGGAAEPGPACTSDADCADDNACTWNERCGDAGTCEAEFIGCDDFNECTNDGCDEQTGCTFVAHEGLCDDDNPCTLRDHCESGFCFFEALFDCDDGNACTKDVCDEATGGCSFTATTEKELLCDDGNACTDDDVCVAGLCQGQPRVCPLSTPCLLVSCDPASGCVFDELEAACDDGSVCTVGDACGDGECLSGAPIPCEDGDGCTTDGCDPASGCTFEFNSHPCDDGVACTIDDECSKGKCVPGPSGCDDDNPCTVDVCAPTGACVFVPQVGPCNDGFGCTMNDTCVAGNCVGGKGNPCDDGSVCTNDYCGAGPLGGAICSNNSIGDCLLAAPLGQSFGFVEIDWDSGTFAKADCFGAVVSTYGWSGVLTGTAACTWPGAPSANKAVSVQFSLSQSGVPKKMNTPEGNVLAQPLAGTIALTGAMAAQVSATAAITVASGSANAYVTASGNGTSPPAVTPKPIAVKMTLKRNDEELGLCCTAQGFCAPAGETLCDSLGGELPPAPQGTCCVQTPTGTNCAPSPESTCAQTPNAVYDGPVVEACCTLGGCALLSAEECTAAGGTSKPGLSCLDSDGDGFADGCPAPPGCGLPDDVIACSFAGGALNVDIAGGFPVSLQSAWTSNGPGSWKTSGPLVTLTLPGGESIPIPVVGVNLTATCSPFVSLSGAVGLPSFLGVDILEQVALGATTPSFSLGFGLGQDLAFLDAPLSDCGTYLYFQGTTELSWSPGGGLPGFSANDGSAVTLAVDPFDPGFFVRASGAIVSGPSAGLVDDVGFGISRQGKLLWSSAVAVPPFVGAPPKGAVVTGHVFQRGKFGLIPIPNSPAQVYVDGEVVVNLGNIPQAAEAVLVGLMGGDWGDIQAALSQLGEGITTGKLLSELRYGANANTIQVEAGPVTINLVKGSVVFEDAALRFAAEKFAPGEMFEGAPAALATAIEKLGIQQVASIAGYVDADAFSLQIVADMQYGPVKLDGTRITVVYDGDDFSLDVGLPSLSFDFVGWIESLKDLLDCDFEVSEAGCSLGGYPVGKIAVNTDGGQVEVTLEAMMPLGLGAVGFSATVGNDGDFTFVGTAAIPMSAFTTQGATLILSDEGVRVIGTFDDISSSIVMDGMLEYDGTYTLQGSGTMKLLFASLDAAVSLSNATGPTVAMISGTYATPFGSVELTGELSMGAQGVAFDVIGTAEMDVLGFQKLDGQVRITNQGPVGVFVDVDFDVPLLDASLDGEILDDGSFGLSGKGSLKIPGFSNLAQAQVEVSSSKGVFVSSSVGLPNATLGFSGSVTPKGFLFKGANDVNLLGFNVYGVATFQGSPSGATLGYAGKVAVASNLIDVAGTFSSDGTFLFTGKGNIELFGYSLGSANVQFGNAVGLAISGQAKVLGATFSLAGKVQPNLDFSLASQANANLNVGGTSGSFNLGIAKKGSVVTASGSGKFSFVGINANGGFTVSSSGAFSGWGSVGIDWSKGPLSLEGGVSVSVWNSGFSAWASVEACVDTWIKNVCVGTGGSINSSGDVCINFPIKGNQCVDVF